MPRAIVVTDEERTIFRIIIPCHEAAGNIIADIAAREKTTGSSREIGNSIPDVPKDVLKELPERQAVILKTICTSPITTQQEMYQKLKVSKKTIQREFDAISKGVILYGLSVEVLK